MLGKTDINVTRTVCATVVGVCFNCVEWIEWLVEGICHPVCVCVSGVEVHLCAHTRMHIPDQGKTPTGTGPEELCPNSPDPACSSPD